MKALRIYLDTSVICFLFAEDAPEKRLATEAFFERARRLGLRLLFSQIGVDEIARTRDMAKRERLLAVLSEHGLEMLSTEQENEIELLARAYIERGAIPRGQIDDALHVALCTLHQVDILASWNFRHLANVGRERRIMAVNESLGYVYPLRIVSPEEALQDD